MNPAEQSALSRRGWLERMSGPALAGALGAGMLASRAAAPPATGDKLPGARVDNVRDFGAVGDGATLDSGGGTGPGPAGEFVAGTLGWKSDFTLHLATNGRPLGGSNPEDGP